MGLGLEDYEEIPLYKRRHSRWGDEHLAVEFLQDAFIGAVVKDPYTSA